MKTQDEGLFGRRDFLETYGWDWKWNKPNPPEPKQFRYKHLKLLRPTITVER